MSDQIQVVTHSGIFHADEALRVARIIINTP